MIITVKHKDKTLISNQRISILVKEGHFLMVGLFH